MAEMRWGIRNEASAAHLTAEICMGELARCLRESVGLSYVFLAAQKYGFRPFPRLIPELLFTELLQHVAEVEDRTLLEEWFKLDENALPGDDAGKQEWEGPREFYGTAPGASGRFYVLQTRSKLTDKDWWPLFERMQVHPSATFRTFRIDSFDPTFRTLRIDSFDPLFRTFRIDSFDPAIAGYLALPWKDSAEPARGVVCRYVRFSVSPLLVPHTPHLLLCCVVLFGLCQHASWIESSSGRVRTHLTGASGPPQVSLRGAAKARFPNETSEAALRDPENKHFAQRFFISVTEEVLPLSLLLSLSLASCLSLSLAVLPDPPTPDPESQPDRFLILHGHGSLR
jgi:hypothetical protein